MNVSQRQRMRAAHERISRAQQQRTVECEELVRAAEQLARVEDPDGQDQPVVDVDAERIRE